MNDHGPLIPELFRAEVGSPIWAQAGDETPRTLTDQEAAAAKLQAALAANRFINYRKLNIFARTVALDTSLGEPSYAVEFSTREGVRLTYYFNSTSKLLIAIKDEARNRLTRFSDYRPEDGIFEPHSVEFLQATEPPRTFKLQSVKRNQGIDDRVFDAPSETPIDVTDLLAEVERNQTVLDRRISEYSFTRKETEREFNDRGELKKERTSVQEIFPVAGGGRVLKLISENGVPLTKERKEREDQRAVEEIERVERENEKREQQNGTGAVRVRKSETGLGRNGDVDLGIATILQVCELIAPRREQFRGREVIVFDFRPRPGFRPANRNESLATMLAGVAFIDPVDKQVMRIDARLVKDYKLAGGIARVSSGATFVFEQTRLEDGVWLPRFSQVSGSAKAFFVAGFRIDSTREYSDYSRFYTEVKDVIIAEPKSKP